MKLTQRAIKIYKAYFFTRCDGRKEIKYFSHEDFEGLKMKPYSFKSSIGNKLQGYFYWYDGADETRLLIFDHGIGGGHRSYMREIEKLCSNGFRVFAYDHTGCVTSEGETSGGLAQSLHDLDDCIRTLKADDNIDTSDISVVGHSWGGYATLNIAALHPDIKRVVPISGYVSVKRMMSQFVPSLLGFLKRPFVKLEKDSNHDYIHYDAIDTLKSSKVRALIIHSEDDGVVSCKVHFEALRKALDGKDRVEFILQHGKGHNPHYSNEAVGLLAEMSKKTAEHGEFKDDADRLKFREQFDWYKMTEQDDEVWQRIIEFLKS